MRGQGIFEVQGPNSLLVKIEKDCEARKLDAIKLIEQKVEEGYGSHINVLTSFGSNIVNYGIAQQLSRIADALESKDARQVRVQDLEEWLVRIEGLDVSGPDIARSLLRRFDIRERRADK